MAEITIFPLKTTLSAAIVSATRPITFTVVATNALLGTAGATFSCLIYDAGTDANPTNAEALQITSGGAGLSWTGTTEAGSTALTHLNGSTVLATVITPRSLNQPMLDHQTLATNPDPHPVYFRLGSYLAKGDLIVGTGSGTFARLPAPVIDGAPLLSASTLPFGMQWGASGGGTAVSQLGGASLSATATLSAVPGGASLSARANIVTSTTGVVGAATTQIATQIADGLSTFTFGGIGTYKHLRITGSARSTAVALSDSLLLQINSDANADYVTESLKVIGTVVTASQIDSPATAMSLADIPASSALLGIPLSLVVDIPAPSNQNFAKGILARSETITTNGGAIGLELLFRNGVWKSPQAVPIYSITLSLVSGAFSTGSIFYLWGDN